MSNKAFTIQKTNEDDIATFHEKRANLGLTPAAFFGKLVNEEKSQVNQVNTDSLQPRVEELEASLLSLQQINDSLQADKVALLSDYETMLENNKEINLLLEEAKNSKQLTGTQFIVEPTEQMAENLNRVVAHLRKQGKLDLVPRENYLKHVAIVSLNYLINNEFKHILK